MRTIADVTLPHVGSSPVGTAAAVAAAADGAEERSFVDAAAARASFLLNVCLLAIKIVAVIRSGSLTVLASVLDSALDLFSGAIMLLVEYLMNNASDEDYPTGKHHFESIGTLVFSSCMFVAAAKLIEDSATKLADINSLNFELDTVTIILMSVVVGTKLIAWLSCRTASSTVALALAQDHRNDVVSNSFGLAGIFAATYGNKYVDPAVALATTLFIMFVWARSAYAQASALSGRMADRECLNGLTMLALNCDTRLIAVDTVRAVTSGAGYVVEIDLLLPPEMPLRDAHDIGERLQLFLESCTDLNVARAYVHLDHETDHDPKNHQ